MYLELALFITLFLLSALFLRRANATTSTDQPLQFSQLPSPTALPIIGHLHHLTSPLNHHNFHRLAARYGPLFHLRIGSMRALVVTSPEVAKEFLKYNDLGLAAHPTNIVTDHLFHGSSLTFNPYGPYWKFLRKLCMSELLGNRVVGQFLSVREDEVKSHLRTLLAKANGGEEINFTKEVTKLTTNILSRMMMSVRCSGTEEGAEKAMIVHETAEVAGATNLADVLPILKYLDVQGIERRCKDVHKRYDAMLEDILVKREELRRKKRDAREVYEGENGVKDFLDILYDVVEDENAEIKLTRNNIKALVLDFFTAGTDTSATAIEWTLAELINNPKIMKIAQEEIDRVVGRDRIVKESDIPNLPYLQALIKESFRLHAPIPMFPRKVMQDCVIKGIKIPTGTILFINIYSLARDPNYWECPLDFRPERFSNNGHASPKEVKGQNFELLPFGTGRRGCPGMYLALQELHSTVAALIQCFDWKVLSNNGILEMKERPGLSIPRAHDLLCVPIVRINNLGSIIN